MISYILNDYLLKNRVDGLVIAAHWRPDALPALSRSIVEIKKHDASVILIGPIFEYSAPLPRLLANDLLNRNPRNAEQHFNMFQKSLDAEMQRLASVQWHVRYVSLFQIFCAGRQCRTYASEYVPMQFDNAHLTQDGSILLAERLHDRGDLS